jgi:hypothetical protein
MLTRLKRLLGWETAPSPRRRTPKGRPAALPAKPAMPVNAAATAKPDAGAAPTRPKQPNGERDVADILGNPSLSLDTSEEDGFDPYNTGVFDRSASWDRISKNNR